MIDPSLILLGEESDEREAVTPDEQNELGIVPQDEWDVIPWDEWSEVRMPGGVDAVEERDDPRGFIKDEL